MQIALAATPAIRGNPAAERADVAFIVNGLQTRITKAVKPLLPDTERVIKCLSGMRGNVHVPFRDENGRAIALFLICQLNNYVRANTLRDPPLLLVNHTQI
jgi:hypothetical protein